MVDYFRLVSEELLIKLNQIKQFGIKHNPTIGVLTEKIIRDFLQTYMPKSVSIEEGFIMTPDGEISKQCDIIIYDSLRFAPFYRLNDIVIVPAEAVLAIIEVKTTLTKQKLHEVIDYFSSFQTGGKIKTHLFVYNSCRISELKKYFLTYKHKGDYQLFDHDTFALLPDEITGVNHSYHLKRDYVIGDRDMMGYSSYFYINEEGTEISALQSFYLSIYDLIENYNASFDQVKHETIDKEAYFGKNQLTSYFAIGLFDS